MALMLWLDGMMMMMMILIFMYWALLPVLLLPSHFLKLQE
jgi:hypothetical protein